MNSTTTKSMNFLLMTNDDRINAAVPKQMRNLMTEIRKKKGMNESVYIKVALQNQIERDLAEA